ncbi:hypothetical protein [Acidianus ambivalens]|uniref:Uncharacterized protein n=1 Tax=Acidianus ambivalens TaxID=2283 RepID=A0A650CSE1_ACIAM|nr:hypothetical protein [Acidianus ambivalens]MQL55238.1 hypothetical protein [Acidianus ambivalens]QGR20781.1 hypothetical protein D1866_01145 [Acidianus ambivalens]
MLDEILNREISSDTPVEISLSEIQKISQTLAKIRISYDDEIHKNEIKVYEELAGSLFEVRLGKYLEDNYKGKGFDEFVFNILDKIKELYISLLSGNLIFNDGKILCKVMKDTIIESIELKKGDLIFLDLQKALALWTAEYITPCKIVS